MVEKAVVALREELQVQQESQVGETIVPLVVIPT